MTSLSVAEVAALLYRHDPIALAFGDNTDEYVPEAASIVAGLPRARSVEDVHTLVHGVFAHWFGDDIAGPASRYESLARELWSGWNAGASGCS